jgi:hypothetical protein
MCFFTTCADSLELPFQNVVPRVLSDSFHWVAGERITHVVVYRSVLERIFKVASTGIDEAALIALIEELMALNGTQMTLWHQLHSTTRENNVLKYKRTHLVELLQTMHTMLQEGCWENIGENEKNPAELSLLGERFLIFEFTKHQLRLQAIEDIHEWMKQHRADCMPAAEEMEEQASTPKKPAQPRQRKRPVATKQPLPSASPAQVYERQAWVRLLVSAHHYSSYFQDPLGELAVFVYDKVGDKPRDMLHLWTHGAKQQFPVVDGAISQQEALTDAMRAWLAMCWVAATGEAEEKNDPI